MGDRVFLTSAVGGRPTKLTLGDEGGIDVVADDGRRCRGGSAASARATASILWENEAFSGPPRAKRHVKASQANATPATDGRTVVALFGSEASAAFDFDGRLLWKADLGRAEPRPLRRPDLRMGPRQLARHPRATG